MEHLSSQLSQQIESVRRNRNSTVQPSARGVTVLGDTDRESSYHSVGTDTAE